MKKKQLPEFRRQEWYRFKRLGDKWRKPRGRDSKVRVRTDGKLPLVSIGYRTPKASRGTHPSGLIEVLVHNSKDFEGVDVSTHTLRIASGVGIRKKEQIVAEAKKLGFKIVNPKVKKREVKSEEKTSS